MSSFETALSAALERALHIEPGNAVARPSVPTPLVDSIRYSLLAPGKRIRPRLLLAAADLLELEEKPALAAAVALEMIHCFTLIHDDLPCMDNSPTRRGRPSNHVKFGEATALLAGDALIAVALESLTEAATGAEPAGFVRALKRFSWAIGPRGVIGGQAAEPLLTKKSGFSDVLAMHEMKTGALFVASVLLPADLKSLNGKSKRFVSLEGFAKSLGASFQIADDLEDAPEEGKEPKNLLFHWSKAEILKYALEEQGASNDLLKEHWGKAAEPLIEISQEVIQRIQK